MAALLVLGLGSSLFILKNDALVRELQSTITGMSPDSFDRFRDGMAYFISNVYFTLDHKADDLPAIEDWLDRNNANTFEDLPSPLPPLIRSAANSSAGKTGPSRWSASTPAKAKLSTCSSWNAQTPMTTNWQISGQ